MIFERDKEFYKKTLRLMLPVMLQQLITIGINFMDNVMVGGFGEINISAVSFGNQFYSFFQFICMGHTHCEHTGYHRHFAGTGGSNVCISQNDCSLANILARIPPAEANLSGEGCFSHCQIATLSRANLQHLNISIQCGSQDHKAF